MSPEFNDADLRGTWEKTKEPSEHSTKSNYLQQFIVYDKTRSQISISTFRVQIALIYEVLYLENFQLIKPLLSAYQQEVKKNDDGDVYENVT